MSKFNLNDLLNSQSKNTTKKPVFEVIPIHIDNITPSDKNKYGIRDIEELADSIETVGLLHNGVVEPTEQTGIYRLISGERRYRAFRLLVESGNTDYQYFPCKVEKNSSDIFAELQLIFANATARVLTDYEKTYQANRLKELILELRSSGHKLKGKTRDIVADILDVSPAQMGIMESINKNLQPELKEEFKDGSIGISRAHELSTLPPEQQQKVVEGGEVNIRKKPVLKPRSPVATKLLYNLKFIKLKFDFEGATYIMVGKDEILDIILLEYKNGARLETIQEG